MNFQKNWKIIFGLIMIILSITFYVIHYLIFKDLHHIFIYLLGDIAFVFIEVLLVSIIIHNLLNEWEKRSHLKKLNMVIETFFSEFGKYLLAFISKHDKNLDKIKDKITSSEECGEINFSNAINIIKKYNENIDINKIDLQTLLIFLKDKRKFLLNLLQNPNLLEHESFSETLMSIFHITEELAARDLKNLSLEDLNHTKTDIERAYKNLTIQWLNYMNYTKKNYPYFYLFAMKTNPFDEKSKWLNDWEQIYTT